MAEQRETIRQEHSPGQQLVDAGRAVERCRPSGSAGSRIRAASPESGAAGQPLGRGRAVRAVYALAAETRRRPPATLISERQGYSDHRRKRGLAGFLERARDREFFGLAPKPQPTKEVSSIRTPLGRSFLRYRNQFRRAQALATVYAAQLPPFPR